MIRCSFVLALLLWVPANIVRAEEKAKFPDGTWRVAVTDTSTGAEISLAIIKMESPTKGKVETKIVASPLLEDNLKVTSAAVEDNLLKMVLGTPNGDWKLEAVVPGKGEKKALGSVKVNGQVLPLELVPTDKTELTRQEAIKRPDAEQLTEINQLATQALIIRQKLKREKDADKAAELLNKAKEAEKSAAEKAPKLLDELVEKKAIDPAVIPAALSVLKCLARVKSDPEKIKKTVGVLEKAVQPYGPQMNHEAKLQIVTLLSGMDSPAPTAMALDYLRQLEKGLSDKDEPADQIRVLSLLEKVLKKTGKAEEAQTVAARIDKLDQVLDKEYLAKVPPFRAKKYEGRSSKSTRAVVMELFTGAQCPPCVAADVAFDALEKTYKPSDLVLLQYHMHIPGPDPLANAETQARWDFYSKAHPGQIGGTPTTLFNGKPDAGGGGGMPQSKDKYEEYRKIIDPLLDSMQEVDLTATVKHRGDKIEIQAEVKGLKDPGEDKKLRFILVEEAIRYVGGNNLRFHHHVVRTFPGGVEGFALKDKDSKQTASVDLNDLRKKLTTYLDDFAKSQEFPNPNRPLDLKHLKVIVLVQDDKTSEILQAVQVDVGHGSEK